MQGEYWMYRGEATRVWSEWFQDERFVQNDRLFVETVMTMRSTKWQVAAMIDGSVGYHTVQSAMVMLAQFKEGQMEGYCERCSACFQGDLAKMLAYDFRCFLHHECLHMGYVQRKLQMTEILMKKKDDTYFSMAVSMLYPTMV